VEGNEWSDKVAKEGGQQNQSEADIDIHGISIRALAAVHCAVVVRGI